MIASRASLFALVLLGAVASASAQDFAVSATERQANAR